MKTRPNNSLHTSHAATTVFKRLLLVEHWIWHWGIGNYWNFNHAVNIRHATSCVKRPVCKNTWIKHCFHMGFKRMEAISVNQVWKVLCTESFPELWQCHFIRQSKHNVKIQSTKLNVKTWQRQGLTLDWMQMPRSINSCLNLPNASESQHRVGNYEKQQHWPLLC